jgi:hypothetical protein
MSARDSADSDKGSWTGCSEVQLVCCVAIPNERKGDVDTDEEMRGDGRRKSLWDS